MPHVNGVPSNTSFERTRSAAVARFAVRRMWRAAQLMSRYVHQHEVHRT